jgi:hypothetical protein
MIRKLIALMAAASVAAACGKDTAGPEDGPAVVARVQVTPDAASVEVGKVVTLSARLEDEAGRALDGRSVAWISYDPSVATVADGVVSGVKAGTATITASVDGLRGSARVTVTGGASGVLITSVTPAPLVEGQPGVITGSGFGLVASNNRVTVDGVVAEVTASTATTIHFVVPSSVCRPARTVDVQVRMLASPSNVVQAPVRPPSYVSLPVGQQLIVTDPAYFCLQFAPGAAAESYLVGVQSVAETVTTVTPATLTASAGGSATGSGAHLASAGPDARSLRQGFLPDLDAAELDRRARAAEARIHRSNHALFESARAALGPSAAPPAGAPTVPAGARVGDVLTIRVPEMENQCHRYTAATATVRAVGARSIWLEDNANPAGGFGPAEYQALANLFEGVFDLDVAHFGAPTDLDRNGRVVILVTKEVNRHSAAGDASFNLFGFVKTANYFASSYCVSSNEGELIYMRTPDPAGRFGRPTGDASSELLALALLLPHELTHVIQFGHAIPGNSAGIVLQPSWLTEAQATLAEEVVGHAVTGGAPGRNYGFGVAFNQPRTTPINWYRAFVGLSYYYGLGSDGQRVAGAPEQCSWLGMSDQGNNGPCMATDVIAYDVGWAFLRWLSDHFGPRLPGGERALHRTLVDSRTAGFQAISSAVGVPIDSLLAQWSAALYVDDRVPGAAARLTYTSWNLFDIDSALKPAARLAPRERAFGSFTDAFQVRAGSTAYFRIGGADRPGTAVKVLTPSGTPLPPHVRLWVVRLQ